MQPLPLKSKKGQPETDVMNDVRGWLSNMGWRVYKTHGSSHQVGFPDLYCVHQAYPARWVEIKRPKQISFTDAQRYHFPRMVRNGSPIWLLTSKLNQLWTGPANMGTVLTRFNLNVPKPPIPDRPGPEWLIQLSLAEKLEREGWHVMHTSGSIYQIGFPDMYATHATYGWRWIEVKNPKGFQFQDSQISMFNELSAFRVPVWIMLSDDTTPLYRPCNLRNYL